MYSPWGAFHFDCMCLLFHFYLDFENSLFSVGDILSYMLDFIFYPDLWYTRIIWLPFILHMYCLTSLVVAKPPFDNFSVAGNVYLAKILDRKRNEKTF